MTKKLTKRIISFMVTLAMAAALMPNVAFAAASGVTEPLAGENISDGSLFLDDEQLSEDVTTDSVTDHSADETVLEGPLSLDDEQLSEDVTTDENPANTGGEEISEAENNTDNDSSTNSEDSGASDNGIALTALDDAKKTVMKEYFQQFPGEYTLPDGSDWKIIVSAEGDLTMSSPDSKANNAYVDSITTSGTSVTKVVFASDDWYNSKGSSAPQKLTLTWTTTVNSSYDHRAFKCAATTFYDADKNPIKGFTTNSYFIADDGIFSYEYFKDYIGTYSLSDAYGTVYDNDIEGIGNWYIEVAENGHVYLHEGDKRYEAVMTAGTATNNQKRVKTMVAALPDWYTNNACTTPAYVTLTWGYDGDNKSSNYGKGALYFDVSGSTTVGKGLAVYKPGEDGGTGKQAISTCIPAMRFERSEITEFAKSYLTNYQDTYYVNDDSEETIEIGEDGIPVLHTQDNKDLTPLYYTVNNTEWLADNPEKSYVNSVVYSAADWYAQDTAPNTVDRTRLTLNWDEVNKQFAVSANATCCKADGETVSHIYTTDMRYSTEESIIEVEAYMTQYVKGEYTLNDGSGWKIKVDENTGVISTKFDTDDYVNVLNPAPVFVQDTTYTGENGKGEYGNKGKYLTTISVPVTGWYLDEECKQEAVVTLNWKGNVVNPIDDHQFTVTAIPIYRHNPETDELECKYMAGTFYSDADREKGEAFLKSIDVAGTYRPTAAEGKWHIEISDEGKVTVYAYDSKNGEHVYKDVAMDLTMDKKTTNHNNPNFGQIQAVTDIKVVIPEWRTVQDNKTLANIAQCAETAFTFTAADNGSSYFVPSVDAIKYANADKDGDPWEVQTKSTANGYNKDLFTKIYKNDRAYSDDNKERARKYFKDYPGTYCIEDPDLDYKLTVTEEGEIYWGDYASGKAPLPADVQFDAIRDENHDGKVNEGENTIVPGTISVWLNGYSTGKYTEKNKDTQTTDGTQRADLTWNDTYVDDQPNTEHKFKTSGKSTVKGYVAGTTQQITFALDKYYVPRGDDVAEGDFVEPGIYETTDAEYKIVIEKDDETGKFTYTFYRPDLPGTKYPLKLFGSGDAAYLRGKIGTMKKADVYIVVTKGPYDGFLLTGYEVTYNDFEGKPTSSSSATKFTLPARTRFTNYALGDTGTTKNIIVAEEGQNKEDGEKYSRLSLALHDVKDNSTIYLEDDIKVGFEAKLPDGVGNVTIDGQGHKILRDTFVNPNTIIMDPEISLTALEEEGAELPKEHYDGAILQVGAGDTVTLKNVTIDGEGKWEIDQEKLKIDKELNKDYDVNVLDAPGGGHPIKELAGNLVSTDSLIKVDGGTLILDKVTMENFFAGDGYDDDRHFIDFRSTEDGKLEIKSETVFKHNASRSGVCIGNTDKDEIDLNGCTTMEDNYCYGGNGGLVVAMEGTQVYMDDGTKIINNIAADTNGTFVQLHKKTDGVKDGDNKGEIYAKLHMDGGDISNNTGLRGGSYGWGQTIYLYNGGSFEMNGGEIHDNIGAGISSIYQQPSADALMLNGGKIYNNTCSLKDEGTDWALDIALMNIGTIGETTYVKQNFVVGAAAILGGYASGDEYLTNNGTIEGNISVYSYFNNEGNVSTVVNNHIIDGDIRLENGSMIKNSEDGLITGNVTIRGALTESAGESSLHNEGDIKGNIEIAENAHLYNSGEVYGNVTVKSGGTLELNCNEEGHSHGGVIHGDVYLYPDGLVYADVKPTQIDGTIYLEYEEGDEADRDRMLDVLDTCGITYANVVATPHVHSEELDETLEDEDANKCTDTVVTLKACKTCGKVVERVESEPTGHKYYVDSVTDATCTTGQIEKIRCKNCTAYNSTAKELKHYVSEPLGHKYVENEDSEGTISIKYDKNGGTGDEPESLTGVLPGAAYPLETAPELTKDGNIFAGWSETQQGVIVDETSLDIIRSLVASPYTVPEDADKDITLYAVYAADANADGKPDYCEDALHVEYYINGGQVHEGYTKDESGMFYVCNDYHHPGDMATLLAVEYGRTMIYRDKAVLMGWSADPHTALVTSEEEIEGLTISEVSLTGAEANAKVYAVWATDENENHVADYMESVLMHTYHRNQFLAESSGRTIAPGWKLDVQGKEPERQNNVLPGMSVELAPNDYFGSADLIDDEGNKQGHYVQVGWSGYSHGACTSKKDYNNWVIAGDANGYTGTDGKYYRTIYDTRFQNAFAVWAIDADENGEADFWDLHCTITLNVNGGTTGQDFPHTTVVDYGDTFTFPADPTKAGHTFKGWSDGGERLYKAGDTVEVTADKTYTALYDAITHTVTLDLNGGTGGDDFTAENPVNDGESFTFPADPTKAGYTFLGWSAEGDENLYKAGDTVTINADAAYTAQYEVNVCTVTLDLNGGTAGEGFARESTVNEGESFTFPADPAKAGFTFIGWSTKGDIKFYKAGDTVVVTADVTYTAQYVANTYTVTLELNGGTGGEGFTAENSVNEGESFTFPADTTKKGFNFLGWSAEGGEKLYKAGDTIAVASDLTFTAQWNAASTGTGSGSGGFLSSYTVQFETNGGSKVASQRISRNDVVKEPTAPTKDGYTFAGWYSDKDLTTEYDFTSKVTNSFTLYAKWNDVNSDDNTETTPAPNSPTASPDNNPGRPASTPNPGAGGASLNFEDHYAYIVGYPDGSVHPDETITRAEVATIFYRLMSDESRDMFMSNKNSYGDVAAEDWFNTAVSTMSAASVIKGYEDGTFAPSKPITRAEFAAMAARFDSDEYSGEDKFPDISEHWAREEINRAAQKGWVSGYKDGTFGPDRYITRAEAMCLVNRVLGRIPSAEHLHDDMTVWPDNSDKSAWYYADVQEATNSHYYEKNGEYEVWTAIR